MNHKIKLLLGAALVSGLLSSAAFAVTGQPPAGIQKPRPAHVVNPTGLPLSFTDTTVTLTMTVDETGTPHHIRLISPRDREVAKKLVPVLAQWRFTPGTQDGEPVEMKVVLPLKIVVSS